jgi:uncharacterized protein
MTLLLDINLLLYAVFDSYSEHQACLAWLEGVMNDSTTLVGLPTHCLVGFLRISTNSRQFAALSMSDALNLVDDWIDQPNVYVPQPAGDHLKRVGHLLRQTRGGSSSVSDAHLAALAIEHQAILCSHDADFMKFTGVSIFDPLQPPPIL